MCRAFVKVVKENLFYFFLQYIFINRKYVLWYSLRLIKKMLFLCSEYDNYIYAFVNALTLLKTVVFFLNYLLLFISYGCWYGLLKMERKKIYLSLAKLSYFILYFHFSLCLIPSISTFYLHLVVVHVMINYVTLQEQLAHYCNLPPLY